MSYFNKLTIIKVKSHISIAGNEEADKLAGEAQRNSPLNFKIKEFPYIDNAQCTIQNPNRLGNIPYKWVMPSHDSLLREVTT